MTKLVFAVLLFTFPLHANTHHFFDHLGNSLEKFDPTWSKLQRIYGVNLPKKLAVAFSMKGYSLFHPQANAVTISAGHYENVPFNVVAHETAHIANFNLSKARSVQTKFRFIDEGFAQIIGYRLAGNYQSYKKYLLITAKIEHKKEALSIKRLEEWNKFYNGPGSDDRYSYEAAASFIVYLQNVAKDIRTQQRLLKAIGIHGNLDKALEAEFKLNRSTLQKGWLSYLAGVKTSGYARITKLTPALGAKDVDPKIKQLRIEFDRAMSSDKKHLCLKASCWNGICAENARWENSKTLVVDITKGLKPNHRHSVGLGIGTPIKCALRSSAGVWVDPLWWSFSTAK